MINMVSKICEKNKFGGHTFVIEIDKLWKIHILETNNKTYLVEFEEIKLFKNKVHFSFLTNSNIENATIEAFDRTFDFFLANSEYIWTLDQKVKKQELVLNILSKLICG